MDKIKVGVVSTTHGLKGEIKIRSFADYEEKAYSVGSLLYIADVSYKILSHRVHQKYDMVILESIDDISKAIPLKGKEVYKLYDDLIESGSYLVEDLFTYQVNLSDGRVGKIVNLIENGGKHVIEVKVGNNKFMVPLDANYVNVNPSTKDVNLTLIKGLIDDEN